MGDGRHGRRRPHKDRKGDEREGLIAAHRVQHAAANHRFYTTHLQ